VVLSNAAWQKRYEADPNILGREIRMDAEAFTVVGVAPASFEEIFTDVAFFRPYPIHLSKTGPQTRYGGGVMVLGRLKPGVTLAAGRAQLEVLEKGFYDTAASPQFRRFLRQSHRGERCATGAC
jgi:hypothetical protein